MNNYLIYISTASVHDDEDSGILAELSDQVSNSSHADSEIYQTKGKYSLKYFSLSIILSPLLLSPTSLSVHSFVRYT